MRILFVLPRMVSGGVERVTLGLIRGFAANGHQCELALRRSCGELLDEARLLTAVHDLAPQGVYQFVPRLAKLIRKWRPTHIITAFSDVGVMTWLAMCLSGSKACWVHGVHNTHAPVVAREGIMGKPRYWMDNRMAAFVYRHADAVVAVSEGVRSEILEWFGIEPTRVTTIYNPVIPDDQLREVLEPRHSPEQPFTIVALGRLVRQKGFDALIDAMAQVPMPWRLDIWGEGPERQNLETLIATHHLQSAIRLRGYTANPYSVLRGADLFVLPSRYEGLGNALIEAMACQCQLVAVDCSHGPREILDGGRFGQLVSPEQPAALGNAIARAMHGKGWIDPSDLLRRAQDFSIHNACAGWLRLLAGIDGGIA